MRSHLGPVQNPVLLTIFQITQIMRTVRFTKSVKTGRTKHLHSRPYHFRFKGVVIPKLVLIFTGAVQEIVSAVNEQASFDSLRIRRLFYKRISFIGNSVSIPAVIPTDCKWCARLAILFQLFIHAADRTDNIMKRRILSGPEIRKCQWLTSLADTDFLSRIQFRLRNQTGNGFRPVISLHERFQLNPMLRARPVPDCRFNRNHDSFRRRFPDIHRNASGCNGNVGVLASAQVFHKIMIFRSGFFLQQFFINHPVFLTVKIFPCNFPEAETVFHTVQSFLSAPYRCSDPV